MICETCKEDHDGLFGSGRFCSKPCANSRTANRAEINKKIAASLAGRPTNAPCTLTAEHCRAGALKGAITKKTNLQKFLMESAWEDIVKVHQKRIFRRVMAKDQEGRCISCNQYEWMGFPIPLEVHHKDGNNKNDARDNVELICPNCHTFTTTYKGKNITPP